MIRRRCWGTSHGKSCTQQSAGEVLKGNEESIFRRRQRENCHPCAIWLSCDTITAMDDHAEQNDIIATEVIEAALGEYLDIQRECDQ